ncbi:histidine kinase dimerization/phospho-acceptor domain-containing protein [Tautonia marina]|uniref:histidine kinase dimerization/phospho-acceptor domain-containing protein n=1 Tax=Tautonia marina TaxID=2653855 RepID=UPI001260F4EF|nr:histidine kinase dimerization/phospho-acceptor domain-containing protein [Tautonia marina]
MSDSDSVREVVHELRNRLSAIASAATAIRKSHFEKELGEEMLDIIRNNVEQATASLNTLDQLGTRSNS